MFDYLKLSCNFICIEMEDCTESIIAERVKRVIKGSAKQFSRPTIKKLLAISPK